MDILHGNVLMKSFIGEMCLPFLGRLVEKKLRKLLKRFPDSSSIYFFVRNEGPIFEK